MVYTICNQHEKVSKEAMIKKWGELYKDMDLVNQLAPKMLKRMKTFFFPKVYFSA